MPLRIVRLGQPRAPDEGLRLGTVRRPPRGVPKARFAADDWYDLWFPTLAPSDDILALGRGATSDTQWRAFARQYRAEMKRAEARQAIALLAALSHTTNLSVGCYCEDVSRCHRSLLAGLLREAGASIVDDRDGVSRMPTVDPSAVADDEADRSAAA